MRIHSWQSQWKHHRNPLGCLNGWKCSRSVSVNHVWNSLLIPFPIALSLPSTAREQQILPWEEFSISSCSNSLPICLLHEHNCPVPVKAATALLMCVSWFINLSNNKRKSHLKALLMSRHKNQGQITLPSVFVCSWWSKIICTNTAVLSDSFEFDLFSLFWMWRGLMASLVPSFTVLPLPFGFSSSNYIGSTIRKLEILREKWPEQVECCVLDLVAVLVGREGVIRYTIKRGLCTFLCCFPGTKWAF